MKRFESKLDYKLYFLIPLILFVPLLLGAIGVYGLIKNIENEVIYKDWGFTFIMPTFCLLFIISVILHFYKLSPKVIINAKEIWIRDKRMKIKDISQINVQGKSWELFLFFPFSYESCSFQITNGERITIAVEHYSNGSLIRANFANIKDYLNGTTDTIIIKNVHTQEWASKEPINTRGAIMYIQSPFKSSTNYILVGGCCLMLWFVYYITDAPLILVGFFLLTFSLLLLMLIIHNHYFILTKEHLIVKNLFLPVRQRIFAIADIEHLEVEQRPKQETALKILTKEFKIHRFHSVLLNDDLFAELIKKVKQKKKTATNKSSCYTTPSSDR